MLWARALAVTYALTVDGQFTFTERSTRLNWALMAAGLVDRLQVTIFPVVSGTTGRRPILEGAGDFDLELLESRTLDGRTQELVYRPSPHGQGR